MPLQRIQTSDSEINRLQDNIQTSLTPLENIPMVGGNLVDVDLVAGQDNLIRHGLSHKPKLFLVGNLNTNTTVWSPVSALLKSNSDATFLNLRCGTNCTATIWVA